MATIESLEYRFKASYDLTNVMDNIMYQATVDNFMGFLRNGQFEKSKHTSLINQFVDLLQQDEYWEHTRSMVPEM